MSQLSQQDDLIEMIEELKDAIGDRVTDGPSDMSDERYRSIRRSLISAFPPEQLPSYLLKCRSLGECWPVFKAVSGTWQGRRQHLAETLNPLIDRLEQNGLASLRTLERCEVIGQGGFGQVFRYHHTLLGIDFAVKLFSPAFAEGGEGYLDRFFQEARMLFALRHPSIIRVFDAGLLGRTPFIQMELFEGKDLSKVLREHGRIESIKAVAIVKKVAAALAAAHDCGIVHRDLKPSNIMISKPQQCRVIDFGLGVFLEHELLSRLTRTGESVVGSQYTAPELLADPRHVSVASDIYSLGAVWFELLTGRAPVGVDAADRLSDIDDLSPAYRDVVLKCLKSEGARFPSAPALLDAVAALEDSFAELA